MSQCGARFLEFLIVLYMLFTLSPSLTKADLNVNCMKMPIQEIKHCCSFPKFQYKVFESKCGKPKASAGTPQAYFVACNLACVFDELEIIDGNNDLNMVKVEQVLRQMTTDNDFVELYTEAFRSCNSQIKARIALKKNRSSRRKNLNLPQLCSPGPLMYVFCAQNEAFTHCPAKSWVNSEQCNNTKKYLQECARFLTN